MSARRPLLTALGATTLLGALWFVPSANATAPERSGTPATATPPAAAPASANASRTPVTGTTGRTGSDSASAPRPQLVLADTGGTDTTPYLFGGIACLGVGAGFVVFSAHRSRAV
ncbi:LPXTG cell wall anchor domain-containing protein [Streptomyces sp. NPDC051211]|uniref:LPXTG cell wall anchor domain-containing protein n=1 Tax=Streptomyces sp. NPDC051211 TaxID=3154643 RepID=UPI003451050C